MKTPKRGFSSNKSLSYKDQELAGLNPHIQARKAHRAVPTDETLEANPEMMMNFKDVKRLIEKARREHPERPFIYHAWLHHYEGYSLSEVAKMMGDNVSRYTAKSRIDSTMKFLREYINELEHQA